MKYKEIKFDGEFTCPICKIGLAKRVSPLIHHLEHYKNLSRCTVCKRYFGIKR